jgi:hypothetical protein
VSAWLRSEILYPKRGLIHSFSWRVQSKGSLGTNAAQRGSKPPKTAAKVPGHRVTAANLDKEVFKAFLLTKAEVSIQGACTWLSC